MSPSALGGSDHRAQVVGIAELIAHYDERCLSFLTGGAENIVHVCVLPDGSHGNNPLVTLCPAHCVQFAPVRLGDHDSLPPRRGGDMAQGGVGLPPGNVNFINNGSGPQRLYHRVAPFNEAICLRLLNRAPIFFVSHGKTPFILQVFY